MLVRSFAGAVIPRPEMAFKCQEEYKDILISGWFGACSGEICWGMFRGSLLVMTSLFV